MKSQILTGVAALCLGSAMLAGGPVDRSQLYGQWAAQDGTETWAFHEKGDQVQVSHTKGSETVSNFACGTTGRDCEFKDAGKKATVSMYFNGPKLVQLERHGGDVVKRRFAVGETGEAMVVELIPIVPAGKTETVHFKRVSDGAKGQ